MTSDRATSFGRYRAPLFADTMAVTPDTVCAACPASLWYEAGDPIAFCTVMKMTTWPCPAAPPITRYDGQLAAMAKLEAEMRRSG